MWGSEKPISKVGSTENQCGGTCWNLTQCLTCSQSLTVLLFIEKMRTKDIYTIFKKNNKYKWKRIPQIKFFDSEAWKSTSYSSRFWCKITNSVAYREDITELPE